jgi:hypothetical protein
MKKIISTVLTLYIWTFSLHAFDLSGSLHIDTYNGSPTVGFSFFAEENIIPRLAMRVQTDYLTAKEYDIQILGVAKFSPISFGGGFALEITKNPQIPISPGVGMLFDWQITKKLSWKTAGLLTFTHKNLGVLHGINVKTNFLYNSENVNADFGYKVRKGIAVNDFVNTLTLQAEAFEKGIPIGLIVGTGIDFLTIDTGFDLLASVTGGLGMYAGKYGSYFAKTKIGIFSLRNSNSIPYEIAFGARFSF